LVVPLSERAGRGYKKSSYLKDITKVILNYTCWPDFGFFKLFLTIPQGMASLLKEK
jgi:hypothetical protein